MTATQIATSTDTEINLFAILDGIVADRENAKGNLGNLAAIESYAEAAGYSISGTDAERIQKVGLDWIASIEGGNGDYGMYRGEAIRALEDAGEDVDVHVVAVAIARSISHNEIVTLDHSAEAIEALASKSESSVEGNTVHEFWGVTDDGDEWRVHVRMSGQSS